VDRPSRKLTPQIKEGHGREEGDEVVDGKGVVRESDSLWVEGILRASGTEKISSYGDREKDPHAEEGHPGEELNRGELAHGAGHRSDRGGDFTHAFVLEFFEFVQIGGWGLFCGHYSPENAKEKDNGSDGEGEVDGLGDGMLGRRGGDDSELGVEPAREFGGEDGSCADEDALHGKANGALAFGKEVGDKGAEGFHADIDGGIEDPEETCGHPEGAGARHKEEREGGEDGSDKKVGSAPAEDRVPGAVAEVADDGLNDEASDGGGEPEERESRFGSAEVFVDRAHVAHLEAPTELDAKEAERHVPDREEGGCDWGGGWG
jgi:hypothetical protein